MNGMIAVKPARAGMNLVHPSGGRALPDDGGLWPNDGFTHRRIREKGVSEIPADAWKAKQDADAKAEATRIEKAKQAEADAAKAKAAQQQPAAPTAPAAPKDVKSNV